MKHIFALLVAAISLTPKCPAQSCTTSRIVGNTGLPVYANGPASAPDVSGDGRYVAFVSAATDLVPGDVNGLPDVFVLDRSTGVVSLESFLPSGSQASGASGPSLSQDGSILAFVAGGLGFSQQIFRRDRTVGVTTLVSQDGGGGFAAGSCTEPRVSGDGSVVAYLSNASNLVTPPPSSSGQHLYAFKFQTGTTTLVDASPTGVTGNGSCTGRPALSADGSRFAFSTSANNIGPVDSNGQVDAYFRDLSTNQIVLVSTIPTNSYPSPSITADGQRVAYSAPIFTPNFAIMTMVFDMTLLTTTLSISLGRPSSITSSGSHLLYGAGGFSVGLYALVPGFAGEVSLDFGMQSRTATFAAASGDGSVVAFSNTAIDMTSAHTSSDGDVYVWSGSLPVACVSALPGQSLDPQGNGHASFNSRPVMSADGNYVLFESRANDLVGYDPNGLGASDVFRARLSTGAVERVPNPTGFDQFVQDMTADGRYCLIRSTSPGVVALYDTTTWNIVFSIGGAQGSVSNDGRFLCYATSLPGTSGYIGLYDLMFPSSPQEVVVPTGGQGIGGNGDMPQISGNGRYVVYQSANASLVFGDTNGKTDVFILDRTTLSVARLSVANGGAQANANCTNPTISDDGRFIAFESEATNLVPGDTNGTNDVFVRDRVLGTTTRATVNDLGAEANQYSSGSVMSPDGRYVTYWSYATNLAPGDTNRWADVFVRDLQLGVTRIASVNSGCVVGDGVSWYPSAFVANKFVAFSSFATTLVAGDTNGFCDVFVRECTTDSQCGMPVSAAFCFGDGALADHTTPCPCGNNGALGNGCGHSFDANGANLSATGSTVTDDVVLRSQFEPVSSFTLFLQHAASGDVVFHDGVLCAGGALTRLRGRAAIGGEAFFPNSLFALDSTTTLSQRGGVTVGSGARRYYSAWYRNATTTFCPPATANVTNGWILDW